jgi:SNF2 family DNA or RNA helicase
MSRDDNMTCPSFRSVINPPSTARCRFCGTALDAGALVLCARCETPFHQDCWEMGTGGCSVFGCGGRLALPLGEGAPAVTSPTLPVARAKAPSAQRIARDAFALDGHDEGPGGIHFDASAEERLAAALAGGTSDDPEWFALRLEAERARTVSGFDELVALKFVDVEPFDYQRETALKVLRRMRGLAILADDVGLGKTIEAGLIMKELLVRGLARRVLVLCPATLVDQWRSELLEKFREDFAVNDHADGWFARERVIASFDLAKRARHRAAIHALEYDLVIVDEAHKVHSSGHTQRHQLVEGIRKRHMLLLTATPVQNDLMELYRLVNVLRPGALGTARAFRARHVARGDARTVVDPHALRSTLAGVMVRNSRAKVGLVLPPRTVRRREVALSAGERALHDGVRAFLRRKRKDEAGQLTVGVLSSRVCSSTRALAATLGVMGRSQERPEAERAELARLAGLAREVEHDAKLAALHDTLIGLNGRKAVVFTTSRETLAYLDGRLAKEGFKIALYHGGLDRFHREVAVTAFRRDHQVLLATEAGAEGLNLQFASVLVNYDLPWNPMRLEQRIGRVHRIGQTQEVLVVNLTAGATVESHLLDLLEKKIRMFELVMGELGLLLGELDTDESFEQLVARMWLDAENDAELAGLFDAFGNKILAAREAVEQGRAARKFSDEVGP